MNTSTKPATLSNKKKTPGDLLQRGLSGFVFVLLTVGAMFGGGWWLFAYLMLACIITTVEFATLWNEKLQVGMRSLMLVLGATSHALVALVLMETLSTRWLLAVPAMVSLPLLYAVTVSKPESLMGAIVAQFGLVYLAFSLALLHYPLHHTGGVTHPWPLLGPILIIWANDTGAYLIGRKLGRTPLNPRLSPKKTREGALGGALSAMLVGALLAHQFREVSPLLWMSFALVLSLTANLGDLFESAIKRYLQVKDSGRIMPGHGGLLDRLDALIFSAPFILLFWGMIR